MSEDDLATEAGIFRYLQSTTFASSKVEQLVGGGGNYVFRIHLREPYQGNSTLVVKHGKPYIPGMRSMAFLLYRQKYEVAALKAVKKFLPATSLVTVPNVHLHDEEAAIIVMDDCGQEAVLLKDLLLRDGAIPISTARTIGAALGVFLAQLHAWGKGDDVLDFFEGNAQARTLTAWATYGRVVSTVSGADSQLPAALRDPPLDIPETQLQAVAKVVERTTGMICTARETVVHGDFWPGNILVKLAGEEVERVYVADWELVKPGLSGCDVGQFCAEMHQARSFYPVNAEPVNAVLGAFLRTYKEERGGDMAGVARMAQTHLGAHIVVWTAYVPTWKDRETVRQLVLEGVRYLAAGDEAGDLGNSIFAPLLV